MLACSDSNSITQIKLLICIIMTPVYIICITLYYSRNTDRIPFPRLRLFYLEFDKCASCNYMDECCGSFYTVGRNVGLN